MLGKPMQRRTRTCAPNAITMTRFSLLAVMLLIGMESHAHAVPAFADQTGQRCSMCHVGGLGPQLTPFGRLFKLGGYTLRGGNQGFTLPLAGMIVASFLHTQKDQPSPPAAHYGVNDNATLDQASLFIAGGVGSHFGGFSQITYNGVGRSFSWDQLDVRFTTHASVIGSDVIAGIDVNNSPGVQDVWNTLPSWGFPYTSSTLAPAPAAAPLIAGGLAQRVLGAGAFVWWNSRLYAEAAAYWTPGRGLMRALGVDINDGDPALKAAAPYVRLAYQMDYGDQNFEVGGFGLFAHVFPGAVRDSGSDRLTDLGLDASWQFVGDESNFYQINARYTHESQSRSTSAALGDAANTHDTLDELHLDASYYWNKIIGLTVSPFGVWGSKDALLYADNRTTSPNSSGILFQLDYTPWGTEVSPLGPRFNVRIGVQYILYNRFNGAGRDYDGAGHNASDNNNFRLFTWIEF